MEWNWESQRLFLLLPKPSKNHLFLSFPMLQQAFTAPHASRSVLQSQLNRIKNHFLTLVPSHSTINL